MAVVRNGQPYHPAFDANGNITDYVATNGAVVAHYEFDAFGNTVAQSGTLADAFAYRFSTKYLDDETGLYYYEYRYYSPQLGRWASRDPMEEDGGLLLYGFVINDPINEMDLIGLSLAGNVFDVIKSAIPPRADVFYRDWRIGVWPVPVMPAVTVEMYVQLDVDVVKCCKNNGGEGLMAVGFFGLEINGGVGTSIGGTSNVRAERGRNGTQYRNMAGGGVGRGGHYARRPTVQNYGPNSSTSVRAATGGGVTGSTPPCETSLSLVARVGISGFVTGGVGRFSAGAQFDMQFGECKVPGGCEFTNPIESGSAGAVFGLGSGARIQVYGRGGIEGKVTLN
jgi:RHS repeat-associated protein